MAILDYQTIMLPLLQLASDGEVHRFRHAVEKLADKFDLSESEQRELLPSGKQPIFDNRVGWARTYMSKAGLLESPKRGHFSITVRGKEIISKNLEKINVEYLGQFPEFIKFRNKKLEPSQYGEPHKSLSSAQTTPEETLESAYQSLRSDLATEILDTIMNCSPQFFEELVVDLIVKMG